MFSDGVFEIPLIRLKSDFGGIVVEDNLLSVYAGVWCPNLARYSMKMGFSDLSHIVGIPGSVGGLIYMNGGSNRKSIMSSVASVISLNEGGSIIERAGSDIKFSHRHSMYQDGNEIILGAKIKLINRVGISEARKEMLNVLSGRRKNSL